MVEGLETQLLSLEHRVVGATDQLETANRGIYLLCNVVADQMEGSATRKPNPNQRHAGPAPHPRGNSLYDELVSFTENAVNRARSTFHRSQSATEPEHGAVDRRHLLLRSSSSSMRTF